MRPPSKRRSSWSRVSGKPETRAIPSPTRSTRPTASAWGVRAVRATVSRLRASQASLSVSGDVCVMVHQLAFETNEIGAEAVAHDRVWGFEFDSGDQRGIDRNVERNRMSENAGQSFAAGLLFLRGYRAGDGQMDRSAIGTDRCPGSLRKLFQPGRDPIDESRYACLTRQFIEQLGRDVDGKPPCPIFRGERLGAAFVFNLRLRRRAKLVRLGLGRRQKSRFRG